MSGAPKSVAGYFDCANNQLTSLEGAPDTVAGYFDCYNNNLTSLEGAPETVGGDFNCNNNPGPNGNGFTEKDVRAVCDVKGRIFT